jgi:3-isopropylmalate/(R)-2-methylmalate dehydratase small subunit
MEPLVRIESQTVVLPTENIDTDQIIPARYLTATTREGFGEKLFADWRFDASGRPRPDSPLDAPAARGARVLVAGRNFGCGSSREHAVWALHGFGFRAVISSEIADIFKRNALKNGLVPVELGADAHRQLLAAPGARVAVDVEALAVTLPDGSRVPFALDPFARRCLLEGKDELAFLLAQEAAIAAHEARGLQTVVVSEG